MPPQVEAPPAAEPAQAEPASDSAPPVGQPQTAPEVWTPAQAPDLTEPIPVRKRGRGWNVGVVVALVLIAGAGTAFVLLRGPGGPGLVQALEEAVAAQDSEELRNLLVPEDGRAVTDRELLALADSLQEEGRWESVAQHLGDQLDGGEGDPAFSALVADRSSGTVRLRPVTIEVGANVDAFDLTVDSGNGNVSAGGAGEGAVWTVTGLPGRYELTGMAQNSYTTAEAQAELVWFTDAQTAGMQLEFPVFDIAVEVGEVDALTVLVNGVETDLVPDGGTVRVPMVERGTQIRGEARQGRLTDIREFLVGGPEESYAFAFQFASAAESPADALGLPELEQEAVDALVGEALAGYYASYVEAVNEQDPALVRMVTEEYREVIAQWVEDNAAYNFRFVALALAPDTLEYIEDPELGFRAQMEVRFQYEYRTRGSSGGWTRRNSDQTCLLLPDLEAGIWLIEDIELND